MTRTFCDRCDAETTHIKSGHVMGIPDADENGNGTIVHSADLCESCYGEWRVWLKPTSTKKELTR